MARLLTAGEALPLLTEAAREAGEIGLRFARDGARVFDKLDNSPVTEADLAIDAHLAKRLRGVSSAIGWLSEEATDSAERLSKRQVWVLDPIDGTRGFIAGNGEWVISAALVEDGRPLAGVLYRPTNGDFYSAGRGLGAFKNGVAIKANAGALAQTRTLASPKPMFDLIRQGLPSRIERASRLSSLALRIAYVAEGLVDAAFASGASHDWDIAAADIILSEAGGRLSSFHGDDVIYNRANPMHRPLVMAGLGRHAGLVSLFDCVKDGTI
ncbi:3'(2'),5'-bisphosphate nucleotidase CysQ [Labrys miyagiensis]|uniref:3'(2'),5'-bisphosphate nucleotidase CysQ n=1 Tax=Labrys miyagiensis TaxID=346912 RepID=A0ABQ6CQA6_9HYPH|nr:3'(2'),5'-bisphosphate nucleotidase CysQ [Labrys miyagiensis]GLS22543.1 3'(2'),5'-bisphosphate nucleotidase CysQ [Labrys miyagiensis]